MTCIVGLVDGGRVYIGGDSAGVGGLDLTVRKDRKVFKVGDFLIGCTTSFRMAQILQYGFTPPRRHADEDAMAYMVTKFVDAIRTAFKDGGFAARDRDVESGGVFLVGCESRLFCIYGDYQVAEAVCGYDACGCGENYAKGVMFATNGSPAEYRIEQSLKAAEAHSAGVRGPFVIEVV